MKARLFITREGKQAEHEAKLEQFLGGDVTPRFVGHAAGEGFSETLVLYEDGREPGVDELVRGWIAKQIGDAA